MPAHFQPAGHPSLCAYIFVSDSTAAIDFYTDVFGAEEDLRLTTPQGHIMHAELRLGDSRLMLGQEKAEYGTANAGSLGATSQRLLLYVADVDQTFAKAIAAGAKELQPVQDQFWGDRMGTLCDPFGQQWSLATHLEAVSQEQAQQRFEALMAGAPSTTSDS